VLLALSGPAGPVLAGVEMPDGYRMEAYRAPVPDHVPGAATLDTAALRALLRDRPDTVLLDVMAAEIARTPAPVWLVPGPRPSLPGAVWLPNVGYGELATETEAYFRRHLAALTGGDPGRPLVFFCVVDCWMSWNAARRAASWGYGAVHWYPAGTDGWAAAGLPLAGLCPQPLRADLPARC